MIADYLKYRYPQVTEQQYVEGLFKTGFRMWKIDGLGFFTYAPSGDALLLGDMYTQHKQAGNGTILLEAVKELARGLGKACIITFSEDAGENHEDGLEATKASGFKPHLSLNTKITMIRGTE